jgi:hypothetical protein
MKLFRFKLLVIALVMFAANSAFASLSYDVTVDTKNLSTQSGSLYFQFNALTGDALQAYATISNFTTNSYLASDPLYSTAGSVTGSLSTTNGSGSVTMENAGFLNEYLHGITFGDSFSFHLQLTGAAVDNANPALLGGSTFSLSLYDAAGYNPLPVSNDPVNGMVYALNLNTDGTATDVTPTPIPAAAYLLGSGLLGLAGIRRKKQK